jgi:ERCC4-type nuclease
MGWAVTIDGRADPGAIVVLIDEREEAESIAGEIRSHGIQVVVRPFPDGTASLPRAAS